MSRRFFSEMPITSDTVRLDGAEAHHLIHVMRAQVDDEVVLFDGSGQEFPATVTQIGRKQVTLRVGAAACVDRELPFPLVLAVSLPRGDRQDWLVEKAVELGVTRLVPWQTRRSVARPNAKSLQRLRRAVVEASKQCGRNRLMEINSPCEFEDWLASGRGGLGWLAHPGCPAAQDLAPDRRRLDLSDRGMQLGIGPEGGFDDGEVQLAIEAGWHVVGLGPRILRTETAALALAAQVALSLHASNPTDASGHSENGPRSEGRMANPSGL